MDQFLFFLFFGKKNLITTNKPIWSDELFIISRRRRALPRSM